MLRPDLPLSQSHRNHAPTFSPSIGLLGLLTHHEHGFVHPLLWPALAAGAVLLIGLTIWNRRLAREVKRRTGAEVALHASAEQNRALLSAIPDLIFTNRRDGEFLAVHATNPSHLLLPPEAFLHRRVTEILPPSIADSFLHAYERALTTGAVQEVNYAVPIRGEERHYEARVVPASNDTLFSIVRDVTARKKAEFDLARSEQQQRLVWENALDGMRLVDAEGIIQRVNDAYCRIVGMTARDLVGQPLTVVYEPPHRDEQLASHRRRFIARDFRSHDETQRTLWNGQVVELEFTNSLLIMPAQPALLLSVFRDVTPRKQAAEALRASESLLRAVVDNIPFEFWARDLEGRCTMENAALRAHWGSLLGLRVEDANITTDERELWLANNRRAVAGEIVKGDVSFRVGAELRHFQNILAPIRVGHEVRGSLGFNIDITDRVRAEAELARSEQQQRLVWDNTLDAMRLCLPDGTIQRVNGAFCRLFGRSAAEWEGHSFAVAYEESRRGEMATNYRRRFAAREIAAYQETQRTLWDGRVVDLELSNAFLVQPGQPDLLLSVFRDITDRKRGERALRASLDEKVVLLKEVHHRVKNNLQIVSSLLNLQARKVKNAAVQDFLVDTQARIRAMSLLHETLYMSDNLARVSFRHYVHTVCAQAVRTYASDARHIRIREDIAEAMLPIDQAIPAGLILNELLSNALKHAFGDRTHGEIAVALRATDEHHLELSVRDDGIGLPANQTGEPSGTLGLLLVENLTRQLGGELRVSREGGTAFRILFPIATP